MFWRSRLRNRLRYFDTGGGPAEYCLLSEAGAFLTTENGEFILI